MIGAHLFKIHEFLENMLELASVSGVIIKQITIDKDQFEMVLEELGHARNKDLIKIQTKMGAVYLSGSHYVIKPE